MFTDINTPCDCECDRCIGFNRHILNDSKIHNIRKRVNKIFSKLEENDAKAPEVHVNGATIKLTAGMTSKVASNEQNNLSKISNLCGIKIMAQISNLLSPKGNS